MADDQDEQQGSAPTPGTAGNGDDQTAREMRKARAEAKQHRERAEQLAQQLEQLQGASKSELEKAIERANRAEASAKTATSNALRYQVAVEKGLPAQLARRLQGDTLEELQADADDLLKLSPGRRVPDAGNHANGSGPQANDPNRFLREKMARR